MDHSVAVNLLSGIIEAMHVGNYASAQFILKDLRIVWQDDPFWDGIHNNIEEAIHGHDRYLVMEICRWAIARMRPTRDLRLAV